MKPQKTTISNNTIPKKLDGTLDPTIDYTSQYNDIGLRKILDEQLSTSIDEHYRRMMQGSYDPYRNPWSGESQHTALTKRLAEKTKELERYKKVIEVLKEIAEEKDEAHLLHLIKMAESLVALGA